jgi:hypothetical protein
MFFVAEQVGKLAAQGAFYEGFSQILEQVLNISGSFPVDQELIDDLRIKLGVFRFDALDMVFLLYLKFAIYFEMSIYTNFLTPSMGS